jgi:hypothetical protein
MREEEENKEEEKRSKRERGMPIEGAFLLFGCVADGDNGRCDAVLRCGSGLHITNLQYIWPESSVIKPFSSFTACKPVKPPPFRLAWPRR